MNIKYFITGVALLLISGAKASMSTDSGLDDKEFRYAVVISLAKGYINIMSDMPEPSVRQKGDAYSKYVDCLNKHRKQEVTGDSIFMAENCYLPPEF
ncbi:TPA: hypothetical protein JD053_06010 [Klebsiella michiganensis]|uniref:hypothetical protein n=1 Tax=Enterobacteriaceae TaxID=543 RepID=UPI0016BBE3B6|nr:MULTISPECIES: hypothetical protein [Enterobacteriaceae]EFJ8746270.1 hypothetical protein [Escherichia coli]EKY3945918.1 hypothetical protein [Enterobacter hormaechei]HCL6053472.1 hypothetical protein [Raoultella ornithinolytica]HED2155514.1 hypothetical protein [Klebsiella variicola subsp. variicola]HED2253895.1 hypothetical protein [Citrobacter freundii]HEE9992536.1 hypothetical protein [Citrobacter braakii]